MKRRTGNNLLHHWVVSLLVLQLAMLAESSQGCELAPMDLDSVLHAYEVADHEISLKNHLLGDFDPREVADAAMDRLADQDTPLSAQGQDRMWRLLAILPGEEEGSIISDGDRVAQLTDGLLLGSAETKLLIMQHANRIAEHERDGFGSAILQQIPVETNIQVLQAMIDVTTIYHNLAGPAEIYVKSLVVSLSNANTDLVETINPTAASQYGSAERSLRVVCLVSLIANAGDPDDALNVVLAIPDTDREILDAMRGADVYGSVLENASVEAREAWATEYARRFCLDSARYHREQYDLWYFLLLFDRFDDMDETMCSLSQSIETHCDTDQLIGYEGLTRLRSQRCD